MRVGLITIGDELLLGKTLNTNAFDLASWLNELGHELAFALTVGDREETIVSALRENTALPCCEMLLLTGGLGPTPDDLTREAAAAFLGTKLVHSPEATAWLAERIGAKADAIPEGQRSQLFIPEKATPLRNPAGTACGFGFDAGEAKAFAFPGVPSEFKAMFDAHCRPTLLRRDAALLRRRVFTFGLAESRQREYLRDFSPPAPFRFSSLPSEPGVAIALEAFVPNDEIAAAEKNLNAAWKDLLSRLPEENIVDRDGSSLPETVFKLLRAKKATVSIAESCTGGALGYLLTETPGSSEIFRQGFLTYANAAKTKLLGVPADLLAQHGAVSEAVALAMARGCREVSGSDYAVAITGIAGPDGGSPEKPVGLVYVATASVRGATARRFQFKGDRKSIRWRSAYTALNQLRSFIIKDL